MKKILYIGGGILLTLFLTMLGGALYVYLKLDSKTLTNNMRELLTEVLATDVQLKQCRLNPLTQEMAVYGLNIKDRKQVDMLHIDTLELKVDVKRLLDNHLLVYGINLSGAHAILYKERKDTATNYQFAVDALTFMKKDDDAVKTELKHKKALMVDLRRCRIENTSAKWDILSEEERNTKTWKEYDPNHIDVEDISLNMKFQNGGSPGTFIGELKHFSAIERNSLTEMHIDDIDFNGIRKTFSLESAKFKYQDMLLSLQGMKSRNENDSTYLNIEKIRFKKDNHKPKKNAGKPNRGEFDPGHLDIELSLDATASYLQSDSISLRVNSLKGIDHESGLAISRLSMNLRQAHENCYITNLKLADQNTTIAVSKIGLTLPSKKAQKSFRVWADNVKGHVVLKDIARPFAKKLSKFTTPIELSTDLTGTEKGLSFNSIHVFTKDARLDIKANGHINFGKKKLGKKTNLGFNILSMHARRGIKEQILSHFKQMSPSLVTMLTKMGDIAFKGKVLIPFRHEIFIGKLTTGIGLFDANVTINNNTHRMTGTVGSDSVDMYKFLGNQNIGTVAFTSNFDLDISKRKDAKGRKAKGSLPIGTVKGKALKASYKKFKIKEVNFNIISNGREAAGNLASYNKLIDITADFSFESADIRNSLKVKPHIKVHNIIDNTFLRKTFIGKLFRKKSKDESVKSKDENVKSKEKSKKIKDKKE